MTQHHKSQSHNGNTETRKRVFVRHAQVLSEERLKALSQKEKDFATACEDRGVWLDIFCPDDACFTEEERVKIPVFCEDPKAKKSLWLDIFCPGESCEVTESTKLA